MAQYDVENIIHLEVLDTDKTNEQGDQYTQFSLHLLDGTDESRNRDEPINTSCNIIQDENNSLTWVIEATPSAGKCDIPRFSCGRNTPKRLDWGIPTLMVMSLLCGISLATGNHFYYQWLSGQLVGDFGRQQWAIRIGTAFAWAVNMALRTAVGLSYIQLVWMMLRRKSVSLRTLNDAFSLEYNLWSFWNWELKSGMPLATVLALISWTIPISTLLPPATLSTATSIIAKVHNESVFTVGISNYSLGKTYTWEFHDPQYFNDSRPQVNIASSSPEVARIVNAVAINGDRLSFYSSTTAPNTSHSLQTHIPLLRCKPSNMTTQYQMTAYVRGYVMNTALHNITSFDNETWHFKSHGRTGNWGYLSILPAFMPSTAGDRLVLLENIDEIMAWQLTGEIWIAVATYPRFTNRPKIEFTTCELWNASVSFTVASVNSLSTISNIETEYLNLVSPYWANYSDPNVPFRAYAGWFERIGAWHHGKMIRGDSGQYDLPIPRIGSQLKISSQFYEMFHRMFTGEPISSQNLPSVSLRNVSLSEDIEAFSLNTSLSILSNPSLCDTVISEVTTTTTATTYLYEPFDLWLAYGLAIIFSGISISIGGFALWRNGVSHDASVSSFAIAMQDEEIKEALGIDSNCARPLSEELSRLKFRFDGNSRFRLDR